MYWQIFYNYPILQYISLPGNEVKTVFSNEKYFILGLKEMVEGEVSGNLRWKMSSVEASIPYELDKGSGVFVSGENPSIGQDDGGNTRNA